MSSLTDVIDRIGQDIGGLEKRETFIFSQNSASDLWIIVHPLNKYPSITIIDSANTEVEGDIEYVNLSTVHVKFNSAFTGVAFLN
jgi:hypothetical protein